MHQLITGLVHSKESLIKSPPAEDDLFRGSLYVIIANGCVPFVKEC